MRCSRLPLVLGCVVVMGCSTEMSLRQVTEAEQAVNSRLDTWVRALNNGELDTLLLMHHRVSELTVIWGTGQEAHGWEEEETFYREFFASIDRMNLAMQRPETQILTPRFAITTLRHSTDVIRADGERDAPMAGHVTLVWVKDPTDDQWKIHLSHMSFRPPTID